MNARLYDRIQFGTHTGMVLDSSPTRRGEPPYRVLWLDGTETWIVPGADAQIEHRTQDDLLRASRRPR